jgi:hypothetical protein
VVRIGRGGHVQPDIASRVRIQLNAFDVCIGMREPTDRVRPHPDHDHTIRARHDRVLESPFAPMVRCLAHRAPLHPAGRLADPRTSAPRIWHNVRAAQNRTSLRR